MAKPAPHQSFESILDTPADDVERPKPLPIGTYDAIVHGLYEEGVSSQKKTPFVQFAFLIQSAGDDVDDTELGAWATGKDGSMRNLAGTVFKNNSTKFYTTPDSMFRLTDFIGHCGIDQEGKTVRQCLAETPNCSVRIQIIHTASQDGEQIFAEMKKTMPVED
jgi:hypothetical protein